MPKLLRKVLTPWIASRRATQEFKKAHDHYMKHGFIKHNIHAKAMQRYDRIARHELPFEEVVNLHDHPKFKGLNLAKILKPYKSLHKMDQAAGIRPPDAVKKEETLNEFKLPGISKLKLPTPFEGTAKKMDVEKDKDKKKASDAPTPPKPVTEDAPCNSMGMSSTSTGPIQTYDPMLMVNIQKRKNTLKSILTRRK